VTVVDDHDLVGERDRRETVGDDDRGPAAHDLTQARPDLRLRRRVDGCGRVVEDEDPRIDEERPRDRDALTLTAREGDPALADHCVVAVRQLEDEVVGLRRSRRGLDGLERCVGHAERDVVADRCREEERILRDDPDLASQRATNEPADIDAVDEHATTGGVVEARHERRERRLARPGRSDECDGPACGYVKVDVLDDWSLWVVAERDALERDLARAGRQRRRIGPVGDLLGSSRISKIRSPAATARCAWPIHMPSIRSGMTSIASKR
jgi:hypothetical protein